jgi:enoyl-CoA hydratase/carnithine racemase
VGDEAVEGLRYDIDRGARVATLTIDRPEAKNAFTPAMWSAGAAWLAEAADDDDVHVLLLTSVGDVFSAGADIKAMSAEKDAGRPFHSFLDQLVPFPKPVVAAVHGAAVGSGFTMLAYVDVVLASTAARFRAPFVAMGLSPEAGSSRTLPEILGRQAAADLLFTAAWLPAEEALRLGFVREVVAPDELQAVARTRAEAIGAMPLASLVATKALLDRGRAAEAADARRRESDVFRRLLAERQA